MTAQVTVAVPVYNEAPHVEAALASLARQTYRNFVVVVSDNASTDATGPICQSFCSSHANFTYHRLPNNLGGALNLKRTLELAQTGYFMWLGGHDLLSDNFLEKTVAILDKHPELAIAGSLVRDIDESGMGVPRPDGNQSFSNNRWRRYLQSCLHMKYWGAINFLFRRRLLDDLPIAPIAGFDECLLSHLLWYGNIGYSAQAVYYNRVFADAATRHQHYLARLSGADVVLAPDPGKRNYRPLVDYYEQDLRRLMRRYPLWGPVFRRFTLQLLKTRLNLTRNRRRDRRMAHWLQDKSGRPLFL